jgi:hypothetical protein
VFRGLSALASPGAAGNQEVTLDGVDLEYGPLRLRDAQVQLRNTAEAVRIRGHGVGAEGGSIELKGALTPDWPWLEPLRIYLAQLELSLAELLGSGAEPAWGRARLTGVVTVDGIPNQGQKIELNLEAAAPRDDGVGNWMESTIQGGWVVRDGRFSSDERVRIHTDVRDLDLAHELRVVRGGIDLLMGLEGDSESGRLVVDADLDRLRFRVGDWLEKDADSPASLRYEMRWNSKGRDSGGGILRLGGLQLRMSRFGRNGEGWRVRSSMIPIKELRAYVPALRVLPVRLEGEVAVEATWRSDRGVEANAVLRDARVASRSQSFEIPFARLELNSDTIRLKAPELLIGDQAIEFAGSLEWIPSPGHARIGVAARADRLDVEPLLSFVLWLSDVEEPLQNGSSLSWSDAARACVQSLRADPRILRQLEIEPATLHVDHLSGSAVEMTNARFRLKLFDQLLELEQVNGAGLASPQRYTMDLRRWLPKLTKTH